MKKETIGMLVVVIVVVLYAARGCNKATEPVVAKAPTEKSAPVTTKTEPTEEVAGLSAKIREVTGVVEKLTARIVPVETVAPPLAKPSVIYVAASTTPPAAVTTDVATPIPTPTETSADLKEKELHLADKIQDLIGEVSEANHALRLRTKILEEGGKDANMKAWLRGQIRLWEHNLAERKERLEKTRAELAEVKARLR